MTELIWKMKPGKELDNMVAREIFGLEKCENSFCDQYHLEDGTSIYAPKYSVDIRAAWDVVNELKRRGFSITVSRHPAFTSVWIQGKDKALTHTHGEDAPHGICLAALMATMDREIPEFVERTWKTKICA